VLTESIKALLRAPWYVALRGFAECLARIPCPSDHIQVSRPGFVVGCGRSGTTVLGQVMGGHPQVLYLREPYHLWAAVDRRTDVADLHHVTDGCFFMDGVHCTPGAQVRFNRLVHRACRRARLVEKTPHNVARIGLLERLTVEPRYVHVVRNGVDVAHSIDRIARANAYRIAGKGRHNQWWGRDDCKWRALAREGAARGYYADEVPRLKGHLQRGAYEWLVSLGEADRWRVPLGDRLCELTYSQLTLEPGATLHRLCRSLGLDCPERWLRWAITEVRSERRYHWRWLELPPRMAARFNAYQERYGFEGRAIRA
jgi:hypothetical protein